MFDSYASLPEFWLYGRFLKWEYSQIIHVDRVSTINNAFWGTPILGNPHMLCPMPQTSFPVNSKDKLEDQLFG
jgi:hypothetical protein